MFDALLTSIFSSSSIATDVTAGQLLACCLASIVLGAIAAAIYTFRHPHSKDFVVTLAILPLIVQVVITLVNGNLGTGVAVMGVFGLVRFRSIPGSAKDIGSVFLSMGIGLANGMGCIGVAILLTLLAGAMTVLYEVVGFGEMGDSKKTLKITVPEDLEFEGMFDEILARYTTHHKLVEVSTTNMGSLYQLRYEIQMPGQGSEKALIDELRCRNGNLKVACSAGVKSKDVL